MGVAYFIWGGTLLGCVGANGFASLMVLRLILGYGRLFQLPRN